MGIEPKVYTVAEVADQLRISISLCYKLVRSGGIYSRKIGDVYRVPKWAIEQFLSGGGGSEGRSAAGSTEKGGGLL